MDDARIFSLSGSRRVLDEMGRTTLDSEERMELSVSVAERPLLDWGGLCEPIEVERLLLSNVGDVRW